MDGDRREKSIGQSGGVKMAKIVFLDEAEQDAQEHETRPEDAQELFRLGEQLSDAELERIARAIAKISQEKPQKSAKN